MTAIMLKPLVALVLVCLAAQTCLSEDRVDELFRDDPEVLKTINEYLDNIPSSHSSQIGASRCISEMSPFLKKKNVQPKAIKTGFGQRLKHILGLICRLSREEDAFEDDPESPVILRQEKPKVCESCGPCTRVDKCIKCPRADCDTCPPCPIPNSCRIERLTNKCPAKPTCLPCATAKPKTTTRKPSTTTTSTTTTTTTTTTTSTTTTRKPVKKCDCEKDNTNKTLTNLSVESETPLALSDGLGESNIKITTTITSEYSRYQSLNQTGVNLFFKNLNLLVRNETIRSRIFDVIQSIPETTGGLESRLAQKLFAHFGDRCPEPVAVRKGSSRQISFTNAKTNAMAICGNIMERFRRYKCFCPSCAIARSCGCETPRCSKPAKCQPCPTWIDQCPTLSGCPEYLPCPKCPPIPNDPDDDGDVSKLDDVDLVNPVKEDDLTTPIPCKGYACKYEKTCGVADKNPLTPKGSQTGYMNGGEDQIYGEFPSFARLTLDIPDLGTGMCGGVLISNRHVLTAQHCLRTPKLDEFVPTEKLKNSEIKVILGDHERSTTDKYEVQFNVKEICHSRKFADPMSGSRYDFAVITLDKNVTFNDYVQPACLPHKPLPLKPSTKCFVVGVGVIEYSASGLHKFAEKVQKMRVERVTCKNWGIRHDDRSRHCFTKSLAKGDTCGGDSGGPVLCLNSDKRWTAMGMVSYGSHACDGLESVGWTAVYTRIPALMKEIQQDCGI